MNKALLILLLGFSLNGFTQVYSLRSCTLLPITDSVSNKLAIDVFKSVEASMKTSTWCDYNSSSELMEVFNKYRNKLKEHLNDPTVIKAISKKLKTGSIVRIDLTYEVNTVTVLFEVIGENGEDVYLSEKLITDNKDEDLIILTVRNWLQNYSEIIPYEGKVFGVLGDQITFSKVEKQNVSNGQKFKVKRFTRKRKHPLLKKIVDWESVDVASGKVTNTNGAQGIGELGSYDNNLKARADDWIVFEDEIIDYGKDNRAFQNSGKENKFGKLGEATVSIDIASTSITNSTSGTNKIAGYAYGVGVDVETWINREFFVIGELSRRIGNLKAETGDIEVSKPSSTTGLFSLGGGYKYLPLGFFYGPQVNMFAGYNYYTYNVEKSKDDGLGSATISGLFVGGGGNMPINKDFRIYARARMTLFGDFSDNDNVYGSAKKVSSFHLKAGGRYLYNTNLNLDVSYEMINNSVDFSGGQTSSIDYSEKMIRAGVSFVF